MRYSQHLLLLFLLAISFLLMTYSKYIFPVVVQVFSLSLSSYEEPDKNEIDRLQEELLSTKLQLEQQKLKVEKLERMLLQSKVVEQKINFNEITEQIPASIIIKRDTSNNRNSFTINKGIDENVKLGAIVVYNPHKSGVVYLLGIVHRLSAHSSIVIQVSDPQMKIPVNFLVQNSDGSLGVYDQGINVGYSNQECKIKLLEDKGYLAEKGIVVTSGIEYPEGLMIGNAQVQKYEESYIVNVYPPRLDNISNVIVVNMRK